MFGTRLEKSILIEISKELRKVQTHLNEIEADFENSRRYYKTSGKIATGEETTKRYRRMHLEFENLKEIIISKIEQAKKKI